MMEAVIMMERSYEKDLLFGKKEDDGNFGRSDKSIARTD